MFVGHDHRFQFTESLFTQDFSGSCIRQAHISFEWVVNFLEIQIDEMSGLLSRQVNIRIKFDVLLDNRMC